MKISVIVPVYNSKEYLRECIASVLYRTDVNIEMIMVDDGSTDGSGEVLNDLAKEYSGLKVLHVENGGPGKARNIGLDNATGDHIYFLDSDDLIIPGTWEYFSDVVKRYDPDIISAPYVFIRDRSVLPEKTSVQNATETEFDTEGILAQYLKGNISSAPWNKLYKSSLFDGMRFPPMYHHEDAYIMHELLGKARKGIMSDRPVSLIYEHHGSLMRSGFCKENLMSLKCGERIVDYVSTYYPDLLNLAVSERLRREEYVYSSILRDGLSSMYASELNDIRLSMKKDYEVLKTTNPELYRVCNNIVKYPFLIRAKIVAQRIKHGIFKN